jgi:ABC-type phosphonate transport system ATPase subunit
LGRIKTSFASFARNGVPGDNRPMRLLSAGRLIVADEPVFSLDVSIQPQVLDLMIELQRELLLGIAEISARTGGI